MAIRCAALTLLLGLCVSSAHAEVLTYSVEMRGVKEVPPNDSPGIGNADVTFDTSTRLLRRRPQTIASERMCSAG